MEETSIAKKVQDKVKEDMKSEFLAASLRDRLVFVRDALSKAYGADTSAVNWPSIGRTVTEDLSPYDFNIFDPIESMDDVTDIIDRIDEATMMPALPWRKWVCKDCHTTFLMSKSQVDFFESKKDEIALPKRCPSCIEKRKADLKAAKAE